MSWLLYNYFLPTLNPSTVPQAAPTLQPVQPLLKQYKTLLKITTRDASIAPRYQIQITAVMRNIERWLGEAKLVSRTASGLASWDFSNNDIADADSIESTERWAIDHLCDALLEKGYLIPLSKKSVYASQISLTPVLNASVFL
jgi:ribosomal biogenesis protein LAS1